MKKLLIAAVLGLALPALAAPATPATPATRAAPAVELSPACAERLKQRAERMKAELGLTEAQAAAIRAENERHRDALVAARDAHRAAIDKILTPEQRAKADAKREQLRERRKERMAQRMERCGMIDDDEDDEAAPVAPERKPKG